MALTAWQNLTGAFVAEVYDVPAAPGEFTADFQIAAPPAGAIVSSVTTDQPVYQDGQTVTMTFTETNESDQPVMVVTGQNGFVFDQPGLTPQPGPRRLTRAEPSRMVDSSARSILDADRDVAGRLPGVGPYTLEISNAYDLNGNTATFEVSVRFVRQYVNIGDRWRRFVLDGTGAPLINSTVTTNHADYKVGESVRISLKIPGTGRPASRWSSPANRSPSSTARRWSPG